MNQPVPEQLILKTSHSDAQQQDLNADNFSSQNAVSTLCFIMVLLGGHAAMAMDVSEIKIDGHIAIQGEMENTDKIGIDDVMAEVTLKTPRHKGTRAVLTIDGKYYRRSVNFEDLYIDHKFKHKLHLSMGISKKILGLEYENGRQYRATIHRSPIYKKLESLGIVGRQLNFQLNGQTKKEDGLKWSCALGADGARDMNVLLSLQKERRYFGIGAWLLLEAHKVGSNYDALYANALSIWSDTKFVRASVELFSGNDPKRTEYNNIFGDDRMVFFEGAKLEVQGKVQFNKSISFNPVFQTSFWVNDIDNSLDNSLYSLLGAQLKIYSIMASINVTVTGDRLPDSEKRNFNDRALYVELFYDF